jgi:hypothetical protein
MAIFDVGKSGRLIGPPDQAKRHPAVDGFAHACRRDAPKCALRIPPPDDSPSFARPVFRDNSNARGGKNFQVYR